MEPGFSRIVYMQMMVKWMRLWGIGVIFFVGKFGWAIGMPWGWKVQVPLGIATGAALGVPLYRIWRLFKRLMVLWAEDDARQAKNRAEADELARREKEVEVLEREKKVRLEQLRQQRERKKAINELNAISDELEDELRER